MIYYIYKHSVKTRWMLALHNKLIDEKANFLTIYSSYCCVPCEWLFNNYCRMIYVLLSKIASLCNLFKYFWTIKVSFITTLYYFAYAIIIIHTTDIDIYCIIYALFKYACPLWIMLDNQTNTNRMRSQTNAY
jgi:hypothetical protein